MKTLRDAKLTVDGKTYSGKGEFGGYYSSSNDDRQFQHGVFIAREAALPNGYQEAEGGDGPSMQFKDVIKGGALAEFEGFQFESDNAYRANIHIDSSRPIENKDCHQVTFTVEGQRNRITD